MYALSGNNNTEPWCSDQHKVAGCQSLTSICKPTTAEALSKFKELQNQINRVRKVHGEALIAVDGRIGKQTLAAYNRAVGSQIPHCDGLAMITVTGASIAAVKAVAAAIDAPLKVDPPWYSRPSTPKADGTVYNPPATDITDQLFSPIGLAVLAGGGFVAYKALSKKKRKKGSR